MPTDERSPAAPIPGPPASATPAATAVAPAPDDIDGPTPPPDAAAGPDTGGVATGARRRRPSRFALVLAAIALLAFAGRAALVLSTRDAALPCETAPLCGDALWYSWVANSVGEGRGFLDPGLTEQAADHPPLTVIVLAPLSMLSPGDADPVTAQRLLMAAVGAAVVVLIGLLGRRAAGARGEVVGLLAAGIAAVDANLWMNDMLVMSETLATAGIVLTLLAVYRFLDDPSWRWAVAVGALVGLTGLARAELLLLAPVTFVPLALTARSLRWPARLGRVAVAGAATLVVLAPWTAFNVSRFTEPVLLSTNDGLTLWGSNCDRTYGAADGGGVGFWSLQCAFDVQDRMPPGDQSVRSRFYRDLAVDYVRAHKSQIRTVVEHRLLRGWGLWDPAQTAWLNQGEGRPRWASWTGALQWWVLAPIAVAGAWVLHRRRRPVWPLASMAVIVTITSIIFYGIPRFRLAADVAAVVLVAVAADAAFTWWRDRRLPAAPADGPVPSDGAPSDGATRPWPAPEGGRPTATADGSPAAADPRRASSAGARFPCLDAYRAIGMVMILVFHAAYATGFLSSDTPVARRLAPWLARLDVGVPVFLVLSAFLLFRPYARAILDGGPLPDTRQFLRRRFLRILPAYWAALAVIGIAVGFDVHGLGNWVANILLLPAIGVPAEVCPPASPCHVGYALSHVWTIGVLVAFYALLPPTAFVLQRLAGRGEADKPAGRGEAGARAGRVLVALAVLYLGTNAARIAIVAVEPAWAARSLLTLPLYGDWLALGMIVATVSVAGAAVPACWAAAAWAGAHPVWCWLIAGSLFAIVTRLGYPVTPFGFRDAEGHSDYVARQFLYGLVAAVSLAPAVFGDQRRGRARRFLGAPAFATLGAVSLSFYLYHQTAIAKAKEWTVPDWLDRATRAANARPGNPLDAVAEFAGNLLVVALLAGVLALVAAALSYRLVEVPALRRGERRLPARDRPSRAPAAP
jgi:peptidoglycan/LPS O-acetylase OafA/YrhL